MGRFLLLEGNVGYTRFPDGTGELWYASCVARELANQIRAMGHEVVEVVSPTPEMANTAISQYRPNAVWWVGHGSTDTTTLENVAVWIKAPSYNVDILNNTIACAESCLTGAYLGKFLVEQRGCLSYLGYSREYYFLWCGPRMPCQCRGDNPWNVRPELWELMVRSMHDATFHFMIGLARGMNVKQAFNLSLSRFDYWINYFASVTPRDDSEAAVIRTAMWVLQWDKSVQVLYAKSEGITVPRPAPPPLIRAAGIGALASLVALPISGDARFSAALGAAVAGAYTLSELRKRRQQQV
jgi:hypothetical protein